ncbi:MAG TPA: helix-turn-helix transcriptional regulator [Herpetosiphonaceae bacterium]
MGETGDVIYNRVAVLRAERRISRRELADALGVHYQTVGYLERGEYSPSLDLALRISEFFGLPVEAIFSRQPFPRLSELVYKTAPQAAETNEPWTAPSRPEPSTGT